MKHFSACKLCLLAFLFTLCPLFVHSEDKVIVYQNGDRYVGEVSSDLPNGSGIFHYADGTKSIGWFENARLSGVGVFLTQFDDSFVDECYMGEWNDGEKFGNGMELSDNATVMTIVNWDFNEKSGKGETYILEGDSIKIVVCKWRNDSVTERLDSFKIVNKMKWTRFPLETQKIVNNSDNGFVGQMLFGMGFRSWYDDTFSAGFFVMNDQNVLGSSQSEEDRYAGEWLDGYRNGYGMLWYSEKEIYKGAFSRGYMYGKGVYVWPDGDRYEGDFLYGDRTGNGVLTNGEGRYEGGFSNGIFSGYGVFVSTDGSRYEGNFAKGLFNGYGTMLYDNGDRYEGSWRKSAKDGYGVFYFNNGDVYKGYWKKGDEDGYGFLLSHDGTTKCGYWKKGSFYSETIEDFYVHYCPRCPLSK